MTCSVVARAKIHDAIAELEGYECVIDARQVSADTRSGLQEFGVEVVCATEKVPPEVTRELALAELDLRPSLSGVQGNEFAEVVATA